MAVENTLLEELQETAVSLPDWRPVDRLMSDHQSHPGVHLAVLIEPYLSYILAGRKTVESRFSKNAIAPYQRIDQGDLVFLKAAAGPVVGCFTVAWVKCSTLDENRLSRLRADYSSAICADETFWASRADRRYVTLVGISDVRALPSVQVSKSDRRGWIVLRSPGHQTEAQLSLL